MDAIITHAETISGRLELPPDKSICHRAALLAAIADRPTTLSPWPDSDDCRRTLELIERLGVPVHREARQVVIGGRGMDGLRASETPLPCGESGTTFRLAAGVLAGQPWASTLEAAPSLARRPMRRIVEPLTQMGAAMAGAAKGGELYPPLTVRGRRPLRAIRYELPVASAQVKSAILLAGLFAHGPTTVIERQPTRDHTERALRAFGIQVQVDGGTVTVTPGVVRSPGALRLPGDSSSAAFFAAAAAGRPGARVTIDAVSLNPTRTAWLAVLRRMGAKISVDGGDGWEPSGTLIIEGACLAAVDVSRDEVPGLIDELPVLMAAAASAQGCSRFHGLGELRVKETDRVASMVQGLTRMGVQVRQEPGETVAVEGGAAMGAEVEAAGDHRTAMSLAVAALSARGTTVIHGAECVAKSLPDFFGRLGGLTGSSTVKTVDSAGGRG